jgi:hypothetical protein
LVEKCLNLLHVFGAAKLLEQDNGLLVHRRGPRQIAASLIHKSEVTVSGGHAFLAPERLILSSSALIVPGGPIAPEFGKQ